MLFRDRGAFFLFFWCVQAVLQAGMACDGVPTHTRFICSYNEDDDESMSSEPMFVLETLQAIKLGMIRQPATWCREIPKLFALARYEQAAYMC